MWRQGDAVPQKLEDGTILWHGYISDITDRKREEAELEQYRHHLEVLVEQRTAELLETEARASHILQSSADGLYGIDTDCRITFINPAACELLGYKAEGVIGQRAHGLFHHSKPDGTPYPVEECPTHGSLLHGLDARNDQEVYWHADGHPVPVMYAVHPMLHEEMVIGAVISFVDISEQRAAAEAKERALIAAEHLAQVRSEFLANMSHEIRTPINGVLGFAEIGARNYQNSDKARNAFDKILTSGKRLLGVINEILDFSKIEAGKLAFETLDFDLLSVIEDVQAVLAVKAQGKGVELGLFVDAATPLAVAGDPTRLRQILTNLMDNALKFTHEGFVEVRVKPEAQEGDQVILRVEVRDSGIGMRPDVVERLFTSFFQGDNSTTRKYGGTGLGLTICKRLAELMGGAIGVTSVLGEGSTFWFTIRLHVRSRPAPLRPRTLGVLLAGLPPVVARFVAGQLEAWGLEPEVSPVGADISAWLTQVRRPGALVLAAPGTLDIALEQDWDGAVVLVSPLYRPDFRELAARKGVQTFLSVPVRPSHLRGLLEPGSPAAAKLASAAPVLSADGPVKVRVLLAEDNLVNQKVALVMLRKLGIEADVVSTGVEALDALVGVSYDLVLMDCQMPEMDGFDATRRIRERERGSRRLPVVAMTANAMMGDRERCIEAGMDDHIPKPVRVEALHRALLHWLPAGAVPPLAGEA